MAQRQLRTRNKSGSLISHLVGSGQKPLETELPTKRDLLRWMVYLKDQSNSRISYTLDELVKDIYPELILLWTKANPKFKSPVIFSEKYIKIKLKKLWQEADELSRKTPKKNVLQKFTDSMNKLFDIISCKCLISSCVDVQCQGCNVNAHISCTCPQNAKIPLKDLAYIKGQKDKVGSIGPHQMTSPDHIEKRKQEKRNIRENKDKASKIKRLRIHQDALPAAKRVKKDLGECFEDAEVEDDEFIGSSSKPKNRNYVKLDRVALASIRYEVGLRATAAVSTATLIDYEVITEEDTSNIIDHNKVKRAQEKVMGNLTKNFESNFKKEAASCILFDGRKDNTKIMMEADGFASSFPALIKEEHYSVCGEPGSDYLFHFTPDESTEEISHAGQIAKELVNWLKDRDADESLVAIGGDSTNVNTGVHGGVMTLFEQLLERKLVWLVCCLHTNELPLRHLITNLDGKTSGNNTFTGPIGKLLPSVTELDMNQNFQRICCGPPLIKLPEEVIKDLSTDQHYGYLIVCAIRSGVLPSKLALLEIGPVNHSRWLTTANRILRLWVSKHPLRRKAQKNLTFLVEFIVGVYYPCWFNIKVKHSWVEGPRHILFQLECLRSQKKEVVDIVMPTVSRSAWFSHSENIIQTLLCSSDKEERKHGVNKIIEIRRNGDPDAQLGDLSVRARNTPVINFGSCSLVDLIDWSKEDMYEPPLTCKIPTSELKHLIDIPMKVPDWPCHTQSIERVVKMVTEASEKYYSHEKRDGAIRAKEHSRRLMKKMNQRRTL